MKRKVLLLLIMCVLPFVSLLAQGGKLSRFGVDSVQTIKEMSLYRGYYKQKNYKEAYPHWKYIIENAPKFQLTPYSDGNIILKKMYIATKDIKYIDDLMNLWDQRIEYWGNHPKYKKYNEQYCIGRKGYDLYNYRKNDLEAVKQAYDYMVSSIEKRSVKSEMIVLDAAMKATVDLFKSDKISKEEVVNNFIKYNALANTIYDSQKNPKKLERVASARNNLQQYFITSGAADCATLNDIFAKKYQLIKENKDELLSIVRVLNRFDCTDSQLYADIAESLYKISPTPEAALSLGIRYLKAKNIIEAKRFIKEASNLETDPMRKSTIYYMLANIALSEGRYSDVRTQANKALALRPNWGNPHLVIAKAYMSSAKGDMLQRSKYIWAATDKALRAKKDSEVAAKAQSFINKCSQFYPPCEDLFFHGLKSGQSISVDGWIGGSTTVRCKK